MTSSPDLSTGKLNVFQGRKNGKSAEWVLVKASTEGGKVAYPAQPPTFEGQVVAVPVAEHSR
ncbi:hypothetical protein NHH03_11610 [Stieleria sp. TO1_6]|uniref:hypothetical protein n=1 Tax=Stieleria tagensis TaxID=2956795 RepID=UPI00209B52FB|nr:hypothetical protein [Stieleria tagensis]MCO8122384.1 hypothetical protein [Stieleria tagensis]